MDNQYQAQNIPEHTHFLTEAALISCGFQQATRSSTPREIQSIQPGGGTAMFDALLYGNNLMMQLHDLLERERTASNWSFLHIIITDGQDNDSKISYQETFQRLSALRRNMNVRDLKIIILGVDIESDYASSLKRLASAAGSHGEYHDISHTSMKRMFHKIRSKAGIHERHKNHKMNAMNNMGKMPPNQIALHQMEHFAVLFTLDISGSMSGHKWDVTRHATIEFIQHLGSHDLVSCVVFQDNPHLVMHWNTRQYQLEMGQIAEVLPFEEIMKNEAYFDPQEFGQGQPVSPDGVGYYNSNGIRQSLKSGATYIIKDPYDDNNDFCCC